MEKFITLFFYFLFLIFYFTLAYSLPTGFLYLHDIDAHIVQEIRYAGAYNFVGRPIEGYIKKECILTKEAARALSNVQIALEKQSLSLKVYDCYRPTRAVDDFIHWSQDPKHQEMKMAFYPNINKEDVFRLGYVAKKSAHSRGSTVDLTIISLPYTKTASHSFKKRVKCTADYRKRFYDGSIDMGSSFDCLDKTSYALDRHINKTAFVNRMLLRWLMIKNGFKPYNKEWWHFTFKKEPFPKQYFNFEVR